MLYSCCIPGTTCIGIGISGVGGSGSVVRGTTGDDPGRLGKLDRFVGGDDAVSKSYEKEGHNREREKKAVY